MIGPSDILSALQNGVAAIRGLNTTNTNLITALNTNSSDLVTAISSGLGRLAHWGAPWTGYTPTISVSSGAFTSASATGLYNKIGKTIIIQIDVAIVTNGTAAGILYATLPFNSKSSVRYAVSGFDNGNALAIYGALLPSLSSAAIINRYDAAYPGHDGASLILTGVYESSY